MENYDHLIESIASDKMLGIKELKFLSVGDSRDCEWCAAQNGKKTSINTDIVKLITDNCSCESRSRLSLIAVIDWDDI